jgi:hypothetical protein
MITRTAIQRIDEFLSVYEIPNGFKENNPTKKTIFSGIANGKGYVKGGLKEFSESIRRQALLNGHENNYCEHGI